MFRDEYLVHRHMVLENEKLQRRLNAMELLQQGKLNVDDDIKEYLNSNFSGNSIVQVIKTARTPKGTMLNSPLTITPNNREIQSPSVVPDKHQESTVEYMPRTSTCEPFIHKYASNTLVTMINRDPSIFGHRLMYSDKRRDLAVPIIDSAVTVSDLIKGEHMVRVDTHSYRDYCRNLSVDRPGIERFVGDFESFVKVYPITSFDFPTLFSCKFADGYLLVKIVEHCMDGFGLIESLGLDRQALIHYLMTIESGYSTDAPYHNAMHAADVVISMTHLIRSSLIVTESLSDVESMLLLIERD